jgi:alpha-galactosidase
MARSFRWFGFIALSVAVVAGFLLPATFAVGQAQILTPKAAPTPHINGPKVYGARPGHAFLYRIPCTGARPIHFAAKGLPATLNLDASTGIISGRAPKDRGNYAVTLEAANSLGESSRPFKIVVGDTISLTPQMGWNDWYSFYEHPSDGLMRKAAEAMIASGMADYGYQFVDIDDAWQRRPGDADPAIGEPVRDKDGNIRPTAQFPDMAALTAHIHSLGLKAGIYTSPGPKTCGDREGSYKHEEADARQYARWGFDLLKYDMCSYGDLVKEKTLAEYEKPYIQMGAILKALDRDVVFNLCQYGVADVWKWGKEIGGNSWRTTDDVGIVAGSTLPGFYSVGFANAALDAYASPGGWNDPDYILIGTVGDAHNINLPAKPTSLTPDEQYSYMSMWSLMAAPLFFSGDITNLDPFTLNVLCNSEVIDIDQDSLAKQAHIVRKTAQELILAKPLEDGSVAVGLFNLGSAPASILVDWSELGRTGKQTVRDLWRQKEIGVNEGRYAATVPAHGVMLVRMMNVKNK